MRALLLRDLRLLRPWALLIVPGHVLFGANGIVHPETFFWMNVGLACAYTVALLLMEWKQDGERFAGSLPVSRAQLVHARYVGVVGAAVVGTLLYRLYGGVLLSFGSERLLRRWPAQPPWETSEGLLAFLLVVVGLGAVYLPFYYGAGLARGTWLFGGSAAAVLVAVGLLGRQWGGRLLPSAASLQEGLAGLSQATSPALTQALVLAVASLLVWVSAGLAARIYERRDL